MLEKHAATTNSLKFQFCRNPHGILTMPYPALLEGSADGTRTRERSQKVKFAAAQWQRLIYSGFCAIYLIV